MMMLNDILSHVWIEEDKHYGMKRVFSMIIGRSMVTSREANTLIGTLRGIRRSLEGPHLHGINMNDSVMVYEKTIRNRTVQNY